MQEKKVTQSKLKSFDYGFKIFSPVNVKANFNVAINQSKTFVMILVNTVDVSSLNLEEIRNLITFKWNPEYQIPKT